MKVEINKKEAFHPFTLTIEIESAEELQALWHRLNTAYSIIEDAKSLMVPFPKADTSKPIWDALDKYARPK